MQNQNIQNSNIQNQVLRNLFKIFEEFDKMGSFPKAVLKYGVQAFLALFAMGTFLLGYSRGVLNYDFAMDATAMFAVKTSFTIFSESVVCSILIDYLTKR